MRIDGKEYLKQIKYTDWVKSDTLYDYSPYTDVWSNKLRLFGLPPISFSTKGWVKPLLLDGAKWGFDDEHEWWDWVCSEGHDDLRLRSIEVGGIGFYCNKFVWMTYNVYTSNRSWSDKKEDYGEYKKMFGAKCYLLKKPIAQIKKEVKNWSKELSAWKLMRGELDANAWIKSHGYPYDTLDWHDYFVEYSIESGYALEDTMKKLKSAIKADTCRMVRQNPHLFPLSYGFINHKVLDAGLK